MNWSKNYIYYGDEISLQIKSFETADISPEITMKLWNVNNKSTPICIHEKTITIDKDELEIDFSMEFTEEIENGLKEAAEVKIQTEIISESLKMKVCKSKELLMGMRFINE